MADEARIAGLDLYTVVQSNPSASVAGLDLYTVVQGNPRAQIAGLDLYTVVQGNPRANIAGMLLYVVVQGPLTVASGPPLQGDHMVGSPLLGNSLPLQGAATTIQQGLPPGGPMD